MLKRKQEQFALNRLFKGKALVIFGARQVGKTTFCAQLLKQLNKKTVRFNGDEADTREYLSNTNASQLRRLIGDNEIVFIDEAQRIPEIGLTLKLLVDQMPEVQVIATGSSSFELAGSINEPLTGRKYVMHLSPFSYQELVNNTEFLTEERLLEQRLLYGSYPEIITNPDKAEEHLRLLAESYLYKDLYALEQIRKPMLFEKLVKALALQVGNEVSTAEIAQLIGADNKTVEKYILLLEQAFVIFSLPAFSKNVRNEIKKRRKIYFHDTGILNAVTGNFLPLKSRKDVGALWENYIVSERKKFLEQQQIKATSYFWRTTRQQEVDYLEESGTSLIAAEIKWNPEAKGKIPKTFRDAYPEAATNLITPKNRADFLLPQD